MTTARIMTDNRAALQKVAAVAILGIVLLATTPLWAKSLFVVYYDTLYGAEYGAKLAHLAH
jgi:hypothetical protein